MPGEIVTFFVGKKSDDDPRTVCKNISAIYDAKCLVDNAKYIYRVRERNTNDRHNVEEHGDDETRVDPESNNEDVNVNCN